MLRLLDYRRINVLKASRKMRFNRAYHSTSKLNEIFHSICFKFWGKVEPLFNNNCFHFSAFPVVHIHMAIWITGVQIDILHSGTNYLLIIRSNNNNDNDNNNNEVFINIYLILYILFRCG